MMHPLRILDVAKLFSNYPNGVVYFDYGGVFNDELNSFTVTYSTVPKAGRAAGVYFLPESFGQAGLSSYTVWQYYIYKSHLKGKFR